MPVTLALTIAGSNRLAYLAPSGVQLTDTLTGPSQLRMEMHDASGAWTPAIGQVVILSVGGSPVFKGHIYQLRTSLTEGHATLLRHQVVCQDLSHLPYRRLITGTWDETMYYGSELGSELDFELGSYVTGQTYGEIVRAIVEAHLGDDGITVDATSCPDGATATRFSFNLARLSDAFDALAEAAGVYWWIDATGLFHFTAATAAPFSLTGGGGSSNCRGITLERTASQYRNRQYVRGGQATISGRTEDFLGDGKRSSLTTTYGIQRILEFTVDGVAQSYGVRGVDTGMAWGYNVGATELGLESGGGGTVPASGALIRLVYDGQYPLTVRKSDSSEIAARASAEGTTGVWEAIEDATNLDGEDRIETRADELLRRYASIDKRVTLETDVDGLAAGQTATLTVSALGLSGSGWLIEQVQAQSVEGQLLRYTVTLTDGEIQAMEKRALKGTRAPQLGYDRRTGEALSTIS